MLESNQSVTVYWSSRIKDYYVSKGYVFTKKDDPFTVKVEDLSPSCRRCVNAICDDCGEKFETPYYAHYDRYSKGNKDLCKSCAAKYGHSNTKQIIADRKFEKLENICENNGYTLLTDKSEYVNTKMHIDFICHKHGKQSMLIDNLLSGHKCIKCSYETRQKNMRNSQEYVETYINSINGNKLLNKEEYTQSNKRNLKVLCGKCNKHIFTVSFSDYYNCGTNQCHSCSSFESSGEKLIADYLNSVNIEYIREKKFDDCMDKKKLPFDFYVPKYNLIIEFDGQHHYKPVYGDNALKITQSHDSIKNKYCENNGLNLLRIPYWDGHNVNELIKNKINDIKV